MRKLKEISLFSGIGGFSLAANLTGQIETIQHVEIDRNAQRVLKDNFPGVPIHDDVKTYHPLQSADLYTVGFPCTNTSTAGDRTGLSGASSSLWYEALRIILEGGPPFIVIENPTGLIDRGLRAVLGGLRMAGYSWEDPTILSGAMLGAPHRRERLFIIAYANGLCWRHSPQCWRQQVRAMVEGARDCQAWPQFSASNDGVVVRLPAGVGKDFISVAKGQRGRLNSRILFGRSVMPDVAAIALQRVIHLASCTDIQ